MIKATFRNLLVVLALSATPAAADDVANNAASQFVESIGNEALSIIRDKSLNKNQKQQKLEGVFSRSVDVDWVGKFVMGRYWRQADDAQKKRYLNEYRDFLVKHYTLRFADYSDGSFKITSNRSEGDGKYSVTMEITSPSEDAPVIVDYRVHQQGKALQVYDIVVEGVSLITTQRSEFNGVLTQKGIDGLIDQLSSRTASLQKSDS